MRRLTFHAGGWLAALASFVLCVACGSSTPQEPEEQAQGKAAAPTHVGTSASALTISTQSYSDIVKSDSPVSYYRLGELPGTTVAHDEMGVKNGTYLTHSFPLGGLGILPPLLDYQGAIAGDRNGAPYFFASNDLLHSYDNYVQIDSDPTQSPQSLTLECWLTMPSDTSCPANNGAAIQKTATNWLDGYGIYYSPYSLYFYINNQTFRTGVTVGASTGGNANKTADTNTTRFHHVVATYDPHGYNNGPEMRLYVDGVLGSSNHVGVPPALFAPPAPLKIGHGWGDTQNWEGKVDEVAIYNKALSADRVQAHYLAGIGASAVPDSVATNPTYSNTIWIGPTASPVLTATANDLASVLQQMVPGQQFSVSTASTAPTDSIQLIKLKDFANATPLESRVVYPSVPVIAPFSLPNRDLLAFAAISDPTTTNGLKLISRSDAGLQMGASYYLRMLGARFVLPNSRWAFVPTRNSIRWNVARIEQPDFRWGTDFAVPGDDPGFGPDANFHQDWQTWKAHNLLVSGVELGTFGADKFNQRNTLKSASNPLGDQLDTMGDTYATAVNPQTGTRTSHPDWRAHDSTLLHLPVPVTSNFGWHVMSNPAFQTFFKQDRLAQMSPAVTADPNAPASFAVSTELPKDAVEDADLLATSPSESAATLANAVAAGINAAYPNQGRYASYFAYGNHAFVPVVSLSANVITTLFPYAQNTGIAPDQFVAFWLFKNTAVHDDWAPVPSSLEQPQLDWFTELPRRLRVWSTNRVGAIRQDSTLAAGASGFPWYTAAQIAWNAHSIDVPLTTTGVRGVRDEALDLAFGPAGTGDTARAEMATMLQRWASGFTLNQTELTASLTNLQTALSLTSDPAVKARINDFVAYVHFLVLYYEYSTGQRMRDCQILDNTTSGTPDALIQYMWRINDRDMVQAYWMMQQIISPSNTSLQAHPELASKWNSSGIGGGWDTVGTPIDDTTLGNLLACDLTPPANAQCNTVPGGSPVCSSTCPCPTGQGTCTSDTDCGPGENCGINNGPLFGLAPNTRVCQSIICNPANIGRLCGYPGAICGSTCLAAKACNSQADCDAGYQCGTGNSYLYSANPALTASTPNVCSPVTCPSAGCGDIFAPCGKCSCTPNCSQATCGGSGDDGCGGRCVGVCADRSPGCLQDSDCQPGSSCVIGGGPRVGLPAGTNVCLPSPCGDHDMVRIKSHSTHGVPDCGTTSSLCGTCPVCTPNCDGRECGLDPICGTLDCGVANNPQGPPPCSLAQCGADGQCPPTTQLLSGVDVPKPNGGTRTISPLPAMSTAPVGDMGGSFSVSAHGTATYTIPIHVPPGRNGLEPALSLQYDSAKPNGLVGQGWSLGGVSAITRCPRKDATTSFVSIPDYGDNDQFCIDGQRLIAVNGGIYGGEATEYRTELDSFTRIISHLESGTGGPANFEAHTRDGKILYYGTTQDSSVYVDQPLQGPDVPVIKRAWNVAKVMNQAGDHMTFLYDHREKDLSECDPAGPHRVPCGTLENWISEIQYGNFGELAVVFDYNDFRQDAMRGFLPGGIEIRRTRTLGAIETLSFSKQIEFYQLNYDPTPTPISQLDSVAECVEGSNFPICKPATTFTYSTTAKLTSAPDVIVADGKPIDESRQPIVFDWNGDGVDDILVFEHAKVTPECCGGSFDSTFFHILSSKNINSYSHVDQNTNLNVPTEWIGTVMGLPLGSVFDENRDGSDDLLDSISIPSDANSACWGISWLDSDLSGNAACDICGKYLKVSGTDGGSQVLCQDPQEKILFTMVTDVTGDLKPDAFAVTPNVVAYMERNTSDSDRAYRAPIRFPKWSHDGDNTKDVVFDSDGDGHPNVFEYDSAKKAWAGLTVLTHEDTTRYGVWSGDEDPDYALKAPGDPDSLKFIDLNADGVKDVLTFETKDTNPVNAVRGFLNKRGPGFEQCAPIRQTTNVTWSPDSFRRAFVIDWDGDGREDLIVPTTTNTNGLVAVPFRSGQVAPPLDGTWVWFQNVALGDSRHTVELQPHAIPNPIKLFHDSRAIVGDFDGDGREDLLTKDASGNITRMTGAGGRGFVLVGVDNGKGKHVRVHYDPTDKDGTPTYSALSLINPWYRQMHRLPGLVSEYEVVQNFTSGGQIVDHDFVYHYSNATEALNGDGWLGFQTMDVADKVAGSTRHITYDNSTYDGMNNVFPFAGRIVNDVSTSALASSAPLAPDPSAQVINTTNSWQELTSDAGRPFAVLGGSPETWASAKVVTEGLMPVEVVTTFNGVDSYGNTTYRRLTVGTSSNGASSMVASTVTTTTYNPTPAQLAAWQITLPLRVATESNRGGLFQDRVTTATYDDAGRLATTTREPGDPLHQLTTTFYRYPDGNMQRVEQANIDRSRVRSTTYQYDKDTFYPNSITSSGTGGAPAADQTTQVRFDPSTGNQVLKVDPNGLAELFAYDGFGRIRRHVAPGVDDTTDYSVISPDSSQILPSEGRERRTITRASGGSSSRDVDGFGRPVRSSTLGFDGTRAVTIENETIYLPGDLVGAVSRPHLVGDSSQGVVVSEYDERFRLKDKVMPNGTTWQYSYAAPSILALNFHDLLTLPSEATSVQGVSDPKGNFTAVVADYSGNALSKLDATAHTTSYTYGPFDYLRSIQQPNSTISFTPDQYGQVTAETDPDIGSRTMQYDAFGQETVFHDPVVTRTFEYDALGRLKTINDSNDGNGTTTFTYDQGSNAIGRLSSASSPFGYTQTFAYEPPTDTDNRGLLQRIAYSGDAIQMEASIDYDQFGRASTLHYPAPSGDSAHSFGVTNIHDPASGMLTDVKNADPAKNISYWHLNTTYEGMRPKSETLGNGLTTTRGYEDLTGLPSGIATVNGQQAIQLDVYSYDNNGNLHVRTDLATTETLDYDSLDRIWQRTKQTGATTSPPENYLYTPDGAINITPSMGQYSYDNLPHAVSAAGGNSFVYWGNGNLRSRSGPDVPGLTQEFEYTAFNLPKHVAGMQGIKGIDFDYDAFQARVAETRTTTDSNGTDHTDQTFYFPGLYEQQHRASAGAAVDHVYRVYAGGREVADVRRTAPNGAIDPSLDEVLYLHDDAVGSTEDVTNSTGHVVSTRKYAPFGKMESGSTEDDVLVDFAGQETDRELGLVNMSGRMYDSTFGVFTTPDPVLDQIGRRASTRYTYATNNPFKWTDPTGFDEFDFDGNFSWDPISVSFNAGDVEVGSDAGSASASGTGMTWYSCACDGGGFYAEAPGPVVDTTQNPTNSAGEENGSGGISRGAPAAQDAVASTAADWHGAEGESAYQYTPLRPLEMPQPADWKAATGPSRVDNVMLALQVTAAATAFFAPEVSATIGIGLGIASMVNSSGTPGERIMGGVQVALSALPFIGDISVGFNVTFATVRTVESTEAVVESATALERAAAGEANMVYRGLAAGEEPAAGLLARAPEAGNSIASHVAGARASQWISTTRSLEIATSRFGQNGVVAIDLSKVGNQVVDLTAGIPGLSPNAMLSRWAINAQEVLIQGSVPAGAIVPIP